MMCRTNDADPNACMQTEVMNVRRCKNYLNSGLWQRSRDLSRMYYLCQTVLGFGSLSNRGSPGRKCVTESRLGIVVRGVVGAGGVMASTQTIFRQMKTRKKVLFHVTTQAIQNKIAE